MNRFIFLQPNLHSGNLRYGKHSFPHRLTVYSLLVALCHLHSLELNQTNFGEPYTITQDITYQSLKPHPFL